MSEKPHGINEEDHLLDDLRGKDLQETLHLLRKRFNVQYIDFSTEPFGVLSLVDVNGNTAIFIVETGTLVEIPHESGSSKYFGRIVLHPEPGCGNVGKTVFVSLGGVENNGEMIGIAEFGYIKGDKYHSVDIPVGIPLGECISLGTIQIAKESMQEMGRVYTLGWSEAFEKIMGSPWLGRGKPTLQ